MPDDPEPIEDDLPGIEAAPPAADQIELLEVGLNQTARALRWRFAAEACPDRMLNMYWRLESVAVSYEDAARETLNRLRVSLGGQPLPDPGEPPPARPDDW